METLIRKYNLIIKLINDEVQPEMQAKIRLEEQVAVMRDLLQSDSDAERRILLIKAYELQLITHEQATTLISELYGKA